MRKTACTGKPARGAYQKYSRRKIINSGEVKATVQDVYTRVKKNCVEFLYIELKILEEDYYCVFKINKDEKEVYKSNYIQFMSDVFPEHTLSEYINNPSILKNKSVKIYFNSDSNKFKVKPKGNSYEIK